jgi:hypothetical protein
MKTNIHFFNNISPISFKMRNVSDKSCRENQNTKFMFSKFFFTPEIHAVYEIMWKYFAERGRPRMTKWRMRIACWMPIPTDTHSEHVILIAFPLQQWLKEGASLLRHTYIACRVRC